MLTAMDSVFAVLAEFVTYPDVDASTTNCPEGVLSMHATVEPPQLVPSLDKLHVSAK